MTFRSDPGQVTLTAVFTHRLPALSTETQRAGQRIQRNKDWPRVEFNHVSFEKPLSARPHGRPLICIRIMFRSFLSIIMPLSHVRRYKWAHARRFLSFHLHTRYLLPLRAVDVFTMYVNGMELVTLAVVWTARDEIWDMMGHPSVRQWIRNGNWSLSQAREVLVYFEVWYLYLWWHPLVACWNLQLFLNSNCVIKCGKSSFDISNTYCNLNIKCKA